MRRLMSHPSIALKMIRQITKRQRKICPFCGIIKNPEIHHRDKRGIITYECQECNKTFTELYGTVFYRSKIPLWKWCYAICRWSSATGSISAAEISREINLSNVSTWRMLMKIRKKLSEHISEKKLKELVEADEAWFGKKANQDIILGFVERKRRKLRLIPIENVKEKTLYPLVLENVEKGSQFLTDQRITYSATNVYYHHQTVNHSKEFVDGNIHTNTIEQIWGWIKGIIRTIHHGISKKYRRFYLAQFIFRYENEKTSNLFFNTLCQLLSPTYC